MIDIRDMKSDRGGIDQMVDYKISLCEFKKNRLSRIQPCQNIMKCILTKLIVSWVNPVLTHEILISNLENTHNSDRTKKM
jgi:hypothetical protein